MIFLFNEQPLEIIGNDKVTGVRLIETQLGEPDESGRRRPVPIEGQFVEYDVDQVILAISQLPDLDFLVKDEDFDLTKWSTLSADEDTSETGKKGV